MTAGSPVNTLQNVLHELTASRAALRKSSNELNRATGASGENLDLQKARVFAERVVDELDAIDILFELLRIELNPEGIAFTEREDINIHGIFHRAFSHYSTRMEKKRISHSLDKGWFTVSAFPSLVLVPMILLDNAIKYAPNGTKIYVTLDDLKSAATVESIGPEILEEENYLIFHEGYRGRNARVAERTGLGRGLFIAKNILDAHNYSISVSQKKGHRINSLPYSTIFFEVVFRDKR